MKVQNRYSNDMPFPRKLTLVSLLLLLSACASSPPQNTSNVCSMFEDRRSWYKAAQRSEKRWGVPIPVNMAVLYQESSFQARARPARKMYFGFIPGPRPSNAFGYAQALDGTWNDYRNSSGNWGARRSNFSDAVDFAGWYNNNSNRINGIRRDDAYNLYLAYHEGNGGFRNRSYEGKAWLLTAANNVQANASRYSDQLRTCERRLNRNWFMRLIT
jgi:hypothetical protein